MNGEDVMKEKLRKFVRVQPDGERHWIPTIYAPRTVAIPGVDVACVSLRRAFYAAFVGPIPPDKMASNNCKHKYCVAPDHLVLKKNKTGTSKPLNLAKVDAAAFLSSPSGIERLPDGVSEETFWMIRGSKNLASRVALDHGVTVKDVIRIRAGVYDPWMYSLRARTPKKKVAPATEEKSTMTDEELAFLRSVS